MNHKFGGRFHYLRLAGVLVPIALVLPKLKLIVPSVFHLLCVFN